ncbi:Hypothetical predicted protein [Mytilus galloprovincialis]|uniref:Ubiquitin-like protease family profile domain-containing protein n=1 Tax=Mytilus galloprovincialis TaxID=29158 RepID=A0A8B6FTV6_MYTGA|nr:Hypothetical predicted protein [Mytilus galloprovincialis]
MSLLYFIGTGFFRRYGHEIWQGDLNRLSKGHWLDDSIVYVAISSRLILLSCNIDLVNAYSRRIAFEEKRLILIPICDNTHWILASFCPKTFTVTMMCSMGGSYRKTAQSLGRYFAAMYGKSFEEIKISHAKNGNLEDWKVKGRSQLLKIIKKMY